MPGPGPGNARGAAVAAPLAKWSGASWRNLYVKGSETTFNFEVVEYRKADVRETPWLRWQIEAEDDPELKAVLASFAEVPRKK